MSKIEVDAIDKQSGSTLTLGGSGTAVTLACGATQTGFGRTGTVDWQTGSIKTGTFTAVNGEGYFVNTSGGVSVANLPAGSAGAIVSFADYTSSFSSNSFTITPNGSDKIGGVAQSVPLITDGQSVTLVFVDSTEGWVTVNDSSENLFKNEFIEATGGTVTTCGNDKIHTFTGPGNFVVSNSAVCAANNLVSYVVVAGGGSGGAGLSSGGGGAGGFREVKSPVTPYTASPLDGYPSSPNRITVTETTFPIAVGGGGATLPGPSNTTGNTGSVSTFSTITSAGGGGGGKYGGPAASPTMPAPIVTAATGGSGGSGGGGGSSCSGSAPLFALACTQGSGNTPPTSPSQGNNGGKGSNAYYYTSGGGGGAGAVGNNAAGPGATAPQGSGGPGGNGVATEITGSSVTRGGGGGGSGFASVATGGTGGGGNAALHSPSGTAAVAGTANTGGGGGGGANTPKVGAAGGSGIVIIRYKYQ